MRFGIRRQAKDEVMDWVAFCNHRRLHSTLGYASPMAFDQKWLGRILTASRETLRGGKVILDSSAQTHPEQTADTALD
jgi:hypothetical protein